MKIPTFEQSMYSIKSKLRNDTLDRMGGWFEDYGFDEPPDVQKARIDNAIDDALVIKHLGGETYEFPTRRLQSTD